MLSFYLFANQSELNKISIAGHDLEGAFLAPCSRNPKLQRKFHGPFIVKFLNVVIHYNREVEVEVSICMVTACKEVGAR